MHFKDRKHAGKQVAIALKAYKGKDVTVYALPRGGVVLGYDVAKYLGSKLALLITRKIGHPYNNECAIASVTQSGDLVKNYIECGIVDPKWIARAVEKELVEVKRRSKIYLKNRVSINPKGKICIIVDDGMATGLTMESAIIELRKKKPKKIIVAVPVASAESVSAVSKMVDDVVVLYVPAGYFSSISTYYRDFNQLTDEDVIMYLNKINS